MPKDTAASSYILHKNDLPEGLSLGPVVAIDCESMGLQLARDRLCLVQLSSGDGTAHLVQIARGQKSAPNLTALLTDKNILKIFHFGRFDIAILYKTFAAITSPVYCTKIASKIARTYTDRHGLKNLISELLGKDISKYQQSSDWGSEILAPAQCEYAAQDVLYLHQLREILQKQLTREGRDNLARAAFAFLPQRAILDVEGWSNEDIFAH